MRLFWKRKKRGWTALEISGGEVAYAQMERRESGKPLLLRCGVLGLDTQSDVALKDFSKSLDLDKRHCVAVLGRSEYQMFQVDALNVPPQELKQAVRWSIKDLIDYPVANATVDVLNIPFDSSNPTRPRFMYAVAARNEAVRARIEPLMERADCGLEAIDIPELAQRNIAEAFEQDGRGLALVSFNREGGLLTFTAGGELYHARQIDVTVEQLQAADEDRRTHVYERVALDLQRSLDNFERQFPYVGVNRLLIAPFPQRDKFFEFLKSYLYLQVGTFVLEDVFDFSAMPQLEDEAVQARMFVALGAAMRAEVA